MIDTLRKYSDDQARGKDGKFAGGGSSSGSAAAPRSYADNVARASHEMKNAMKRPTLLDRLMGRKSHYGVDAKLRSQEND